MKEKFIAIVLLLLVSIPALSPLFHKGFFESDDGEWMVIRFSAFYQELRNGQFPVRYLTRLNHEYGYPVANFLYPGFMYIAVVPKVLGFGFVDAIKIVFGASLVFSCICTYLWLSKLFDRFSSLVGAIVYLYAPYHLFDVYKRGSVGEVLGLAVIPFILWQLESKSVFWTACGLAFLLISHNTLAALFLPVILFYMLLDFVIDSKNKKILIYQYSSILLFGLGIAAFFWIPAIVDLQYTIFSQTSVANWREYFAQESLIGISTVVTILFVCILFFTKKLTIAKHRLTILLLSVGIVSLFFAHPVSTPLWSIIPVSFIQFPFRFLSVTILCVAFLIAVSLSVLSKKLQMICAVSIVLITLMQARSFIQPSTYIDKGEGFYTTNMDTTTVKKEYMPKWVLTTPIEKAKEKATVVDGEILYTKQKTNALEFSVNAPKDTTVLVNTIFFPGWYATLNQKVIPISYNNPKGLITIAVPQGKHSVFVGFSETGIRMFSNVLSLISSAMLVIFSMKRRVFI